MVESVCLQCAVCSAVCSVVCRAFMGGAEPRVKCLTLPVWGRGKEGRGDELGGRGGNRGKE